MLVVMGYEWWSVCGFSSVSGLGVSVLVVLCGGVCVTCDMGVDVVDICEVLGATSGCYEVTASSPRLSLSSGIIIIFKEC